jgi:hypothetical protein
MKYYILRAGRRACILNQIQTVVMWCEPHVAGLVMCSPNRLHCSCAPLDRQDDLLGIGVASVAVTERCIVQLTFNCVSAEGLLPSL